jgi:tRNA 2-thiouridine synthesizing protein A
MRDLASGEVLEVHATDPGAPGDFKHFCDTTGHRLLDSTEADGVFVIRIESVRSA